MKRIAITGPESTGKSWLTVQLAEHFQAPYVPEYSRKYLDALGRDYNYDDILAIARGQLKEEEATAKMNGTQWLFSDTDLLVSYIWCQVKYQKVHPWIVEKLKTHTYNHYLMCNIDLPWQPDPLREHPHRRKEIYNLYIIALEQFNLPYTVISGVGEARLINALNALKEGVLSQF